MVQRSHLFGVLEHYHKRGMLEVTSVEVNIDQVAPAYLDFVDENKGLLGAYMDKLNLSELNLMGFVDGFCDFYNRNLENDDELIDKVSQLWCDVLESDSLADLGEVMGLVAMVYFNKR
jgi:hypothetical protein